MNWTEIDARFPEPAPTGGEVRAYSARMREQADGLVTRAARLALGLPAKAIERVELDSVLEEAVKTDYVMRDPGMPAMLALVAAIEKHWDGVAACTGKRALGSRIVNDKTFGGNTTAFARHLATAARSQLPALRVVAAMEEVRAAFRAGTVVDARVAVLAARLFVGEIVAAPEVVATTRAWLAGEAIEIVEAATPVRAVADGEDPRIKIFERFAGELGDDVSIDRELAMVEEAAEQEGWHRYLERERAPIEDAVIRAWMARHALPEGWEALVDPIVACWLGVESRAQLPLEERLQDLTRSAVRIVVRNNEWVFAAIALATGKLATRRADAVGFKPGQFFKEDVRKLFEYLGLAVVTNARAEDVEPAWLDFLARRSPATTPRIGGETLRWKHLLAVQCAISHRLGKQPREHTGVALRRLVTGV